MDVSGRNAGAGGGSIASRQFADTVSVLARCGNPSLQEVLYLHSQFSTRTLTGYMLVDPNTDVQLSIVG